MILIYIGILILTGSWFFLKKLTNLQKEENMIVLIFASFWYVFIEAIDPL